MTSPVIGISFTNALVFGAYGQFYRFLAISENEPTRGTVLLNV